MFKNISNYHQLGVPRSKIMIRTILREISEGETKDAVNGNVVLKGKFTAVTDKVCLQVLQSTTVYEAPCNLINCHWCFEK